MEGAVEKVDAEEAAYVRGEKSAAIRIAKFALRDAGVDDPLAYAASYKAMEMECRTHLRGIFEELENPGEYDEELALPDLIRRLSKLI